MKPTTVTNVITTEVPQLLFSLDLHIRKGHTNSYGCLSMEMFRYDMIM